MATLRKAILRRAIVILAIPMILEMLMESLFGVSICSSSRGWEWIRWPLWR